MSQMNLDDEPGCLVLVAMFGLAVAFFWGLCEGHSSETQRSDIRWHETLVQRGLAEYYLDEHHERQWRLYQDAPATKEGK